MKLWNGKYVWAESGSTLVREVSLGMLAGVAAAFLVVGGFLHEASAQAPAPPGSQPSDEGTSHSSQTYAPVGKSGYVVPIPEIKLERIIRERPREAAPAAPKGEEPSPAGQPEPSEEAEVQEPQEPVRLPFDPARKLQQLAPTSEPRGIQEPSPDQDRAPFLAAPTAPDDVMEAPLPRKEILGKKPAPTIPGLLEAAPLKEAQKPLPLKAQEGLSVAGPEEMIPLGTRGEPEVILPVRPEGSSLRVPGGATTGKPPFEVPKEEAPALIRPGQEEKTAPKEQLAPVEPFVLPPKEAFQSPLDPDTPDTFEVKLYLRETAPILEEMSLLMTRAPAMSIGEFDPSEPNSPIFPKDVHLKMDSMKRDLQIIDSKTFAIIPPKKYERFHALIRDSITQTHQACDAIVNFMSEPTEVNLRAVQEHLHRAKELIQKTRAGQA